MKMGRLSEAREEIQRAMRFSALMSRIIASASRPVDSSQDVEQQSNIAEYVVLYEFEAGSLIRPSLQRRPTSPEFYNPSGKFCLRRSFVLVTGGGPPGCPISRAHFCARSRAFSKPSVSTLYPVLTRIFSSHHLQSLIRTIPRSPYA
jgi:hypothetical protein